ncbi:MAG: VOC family protein [Flaviflexus sp.]|uniref:VOC family protein n=1 Tax=Flaviflexus sp. TaxID=1969482 RepID=UPI00352DE6B0
MPSTIPCLWFDKDAEEAAEFYCSTFPNSKILRVDRSPIDNPSVGEGAVLTVEFELDGTRYTALNGGPYFQFSEAISFQIDCADQKEVDYYWNALTAGGEESQCGWLKDRYGLSWQVVPRRLVELINHSDPEVARRVGEVMLTMRKIDVDELQKAAAIS